MARRPRFDAPRALHHAMNRGIAKRPIFHGRAEVRYFLACLATEARRGEIEILAFVFIPNHFHVLVETADGSLSDAIGLAENRYVRWINPRLGRDGPLFRGRFASKPILSDVQLVMTVRYIDRNALEAGLVKRSIDYPWSSAFHYARPAGPAWMSRGRIESIVCEQLGLDRYDPSAYERVFGGCATPGEEWVVERGLVTPDDPEGFEDLVRGARTAVRGWMARRTCVADDGRVRPPLVPPGDLVRRIVDARTHDADWTVRPAKRTKPAWPILAAGLLRTASGLTVCEIEQRLGLSTSKVYRSIADHAQLFHRDDEYAERATTLASAAVRAFYEPVLPRCRRELSEKKDPGSVPFT